MEDGFATARATNARRKRVSQRTSRPPCVLPHSFDPFPAVAVEFDESRALRRLCTHGRPILRCTLVGVTRLPPFPADLISLTCSSRSCLDFRLSTILRSVVVRQSRRSPIGEISLLVNSQSVKQKRQKFCHFASNLRFYRVGFRVRE